MYLLVKVITSEMTPKYINFGPKLSGTFCWSIFRRGARHKIHPNAFIYVTTLNNFFNLTDVARISHNKSELHKKELNNLRKKFGIDHHEEKVANLAPGYTDRAQVRRETIGSLNHNEKTEVASVEQ